MGRIEVRAIRLVQNRRVLYVTAVPARDIIARTSVDVWDSDLAEDDRGYQRSLQASRVKGVAQYVSGDEAIMPLGGLLNARSDAQEAWGSRLAFAPDPGQSGPIQSGTLSLPGSDDPLWTVDMQHRLAGFEYAIGHMGREDLADFPVVVTIADGLSKMDEIEQFELINTTQKKVATDLARQLLATQFKYFNDSLPDPTKEWQARGALVANWLNEHGSVFKGRIIPPNKTARQAPGGITQETTFVSSLKPVLTTPFLQRKHEREVSELIDAYWGGVRLVWPQAIAHPKETVILKGPGVYPLHMVMPDVLEVLRSSQRPLTSENMADAMAGWRRLGEDYWDKSNTETGATRFGSSGQGHARIAAELRPLLPAPSYESY